MSRPNPEDRQYTYIFVGEAPTDETIIYANSLDEAKKCFKEEFGIDPDKFEITRREPGYSRKGSPFDS
jgi:hypothetical protein